MALQSSGQISLNDIHVEAGGSSGTQASINDTDIRSLISASSQQSNLSFNQFYGAAAAVPLTLSRTATVASGITPGGLRQSYMSISDTVSIPAIPSGGAGKRLFVMVAGNRDWQGAVRYGRTNQFSSMTVNTTSLSKISEGHSDYNSAAIGIGFGDQSGTVTLTYNLNSRIGGGAGYFVLHVIDGVSDYIWDQTTYTNRYSSSSRTLSRYPTYNGSYAGGKELLVFAGATSNSSTYWTWSPSNGRTYTLDDGFDNGTNEWHSTYSHFGDYGPPGSQFNLNGTYSGPRANNGDGMVHTLIGLK